MNIQRTALICDISLLAIEDAAAQLPASRLYGLQIHQSCLSSVREMLREIMEQTRGNPLAPAISITVCPAMPAGAWALWSGDHCIWSPGV